jgi:hypothetical protein
MSCYRDGGASLSTRGCRGWRWRRSSPSTRMQTMNKLEQRELTVDFWGTRSNRLRSLSGGGRGVKLLSNPSQRFLIAFIWPRLPPSTSWKQFHTKAFMASGKSSSRERAHVLHVASAPLLLRLARWSSPARPTHAVEAFSTPSGHLPHEARRNPVASRWSERLAAPIFSWDINSHLGHV